MLDEKDLIIVDTLKKNARLSTQQISKKTGIPITTVHYRLKNLRKEGVIKGQTLVLDYEKMGKGFHVVVLLYLDTKVLKKKKLSQERLLEKLMKLQQVERGYIVIGESYMVIEVRVKDHMEYKDFLLKKLQNYEELNDTKSMVVISEFT